MKKMNVLKRVMSGVLAVTTVLTSAVFSVLAEENGEKVTRYDLVAEIADGQEDMDVNGFKWSTYDWRVQALTLSEKEYGRVLRVTNTVKTGTESAPAPQNAGVIEYTGNALTGTYSVSFDLKLINMPGEKTPIELYIYDGSSRRSGYLRINDGVLELSRSGNYIPYYVDTTVPNAGDVYAMPIGVGEWVNIEYVVDTVNKKLSWYVNGENVVPERSFGTSSSISATGELKKMQFATRNETQAAKEYFYIDNFKLGTISEVAKKAEDNKMLEQQIHDEGSEKGVPSDIFLAPATKEALKSETVTKYAISFDVNVTSSTGFMFDLMGNAISGGYPNLCPVIIEATTGTSSFGRIGVHKTTAWPGYKNAMSTEGYYISEFPIGEWFNITIVADKRAKTFDVFADGKYVGTTDASTFTKSGTTYDITDFSPLQISVIDSEKTSIAKYNNVRIFNVTEGIESFEAEAKIKNGNIVVNLSEHNDNVTELNNISLQDKDGNAVGIKQIENNGSVLTIIPETILDFYTVTLPERMFSVSGARLENNVIEATGVVSDITVIPQKTGGIFTDKSDILFNIKAKNTDTVNINIVGTATVINEAGEALWSEDIVLENVKANAFSEKTVINPAWKGETFGTFKLLVSLKPEDDAGITIEKEIPFGVVASSGVKNPKTGLSSHYVSGYGTKEGDFAEETAINAIGGFGINREGLEWNKYEISQGNYALSARQSEYFEALAQNGITPMAILYNGCWIYGREEGEEAEFMPMPVTDYQRSKYSEYVKKAVLDTKDYGTIYEIGNEWNLNYWNKTHTWANGEEVTLTVKDHYVPMMKAAYDAVKSIDKNIPVVGIAAGTGSITTFVQEVIDNGGLEYCDMISIHPYYITKSPEEQDIRAVVASIRKLLENAGKPDMPIVISEWGWSTGREDTTEEEQAMYAVRGASLVSDITDYCIFFSAQEVSTDNAEQKGYGIVKGTQDENELAPKPVYAALSFYNSVTGNKEVSLLTTDANKNYQREFEGENEVVIQFWNPENQTEFILPQTDGVVTLYDMYGNEKTVDAISGNYILTAEEKPQYLVIKKGLNVEKAAFTAKAFEDIAIGDKAEVEFMVSNGTEYDEILTKICVGYDEDGRVINVAFENFTAEKGKRVTEKVSVVKTQDTKSVKGFIWKGMIPLAGDSEIK